MRQFYSQPITPGCFCDERRRRRAVEYIRGNAERHGFLGRVQFRQYPRDRGTRDIIPIEVRVWI